MYASARGFAALFLLMLWCTPRVAHAWLETRLRSDVATIDIEPSGDATVTHELVLGVRGGPLKSFQLDGVDSDADPLPDATVTRAKSGQAPSTPIPLLVQKRDDGVLELEIDHEKGLRTGVYLFVFRYRTRLLERQLIRRQGLLAEVRWVGPRFADGLDAARVIFRLPTAPNPPKLVDRAEIAGRVDPEAELGGVFIANLRRAADKDELEVVRPHVARGEPVPWHITTDARIFKALPEAAAVKPAMGRTSANVPTPAASRSKVLGLLALLVLATGYALLVSLKARMVSQAAAVCEANVRALVKLPLALRAALSGTLLASAFAIAFALERPTLAALLLISAMLLSVQFAVPKKVVLRGPGHWLPISDGEAFARKARKLPGKWLDAGTLPGAFTMLCTVSAFVAALLFVLPTSPYHFLLVLLGATCMVPIFAIGRGSELPADAAQVPQKPLRTLSRKLRKHPNLKVVAWARIPEGRQEADELRLLIQLRDAPPGFVALELGLDYQHAIGGMSATPYVLVRVREGSPCCERLPRSVVWTRGRKAEERAAVLRPKLPTVGFWLALVEELTSELTKTSPNSPHSRSSSAISRGRASVTAKPARVASPAHAT